MPRQPEPYTKPTQAMSVHRLPVWTTAALRVSGQEQLAV